MFFASSTQKKLSIRVDTYIPASFLQLFFLNALTNVDGIICRHVDPTLPPPST